MLWVGLSEFAGRDTEPEQCTLLKSEASELGCQREAHAANIWWVFTCALVYQAVKRIVIGSLSLHLSAFLYTCCVEDSALQYAELKAYEHRSGHVLIYPDHFQIRPRSVPSPLDQNLLSLKQRGQCVIADEAHGIS